jgi:hypothetical protein
MGSSRQRKSTRAGKAHLLGQGSGRAPAIHLESMEARPAAEPVAQSGPAPSGAAGVPIGAGDSACGDTLRRIRAGLEGAKSAAYVSSIALTVQAADADPEVALVLRHAVADEIGRQVERIDGLLDGVTP